MPVRMKKRAKTRLKAMRWLKKAVVKNNVLTRSLRFLTLKATKARRSHNPLQKFHLQAQVNLLKSAWVCQVFLSQKILLQQWNPYHEVSQCLNLLEISRLNKNHNLKVEILHQVKLVVAMQALIVKFQATIDRAPVSESLERKGY